MMPGKMEMLQGHSGGGISRRSDGVGSILEALRRTSQEERIFQRSLQGKLPSGCKNVDRLARMMRWVNVMSFK